MRRDERPAWAIDSEELKAWEAQADKINRELGALLERWHGLLMEYAEIRDSGLSRNPGEGLRFAIITSEERAELQRIDAEMKAVGDKMAPWFRELAAHAARFPRPKPRSDY